jgi:hypothetical protein
MRLPDGWADSGRWAPEALAVINTNSTLLESTRLGLSLTAVRVSGRSYDPNLLARLLPGEWHWMVRAAYLAVGLVAIGLAVRLAGAAKGQLGARRGSVRATDRAG